MGLAVAALQSTDENEWSILAVVDAECRHNLTVSRLGSAQPTN
jgi:hypothetical protein